MKARKRKNGTYFYTYLQTIPAVMKNNVDVNRAWKNFNSTPR